MSSAEQIQARLQQLQLEEALIAKQVDDAIALFDREQRLVLFNEQLTRMWGLTGEWLQQHPSLTDFVARLVTQGHWDTEQQQQFWVVYDLLVHDNHAFRLTQRDGSCIAVHMTLTSEQGCLLTVRDLTEREQIQSQLSHEVRRLTFLLGLTERLQTSENLFEIGKFSLVYLVEAMGAAFGDVKVISGSGSERYAGTLTNQISGQFIATHGLPAIAEMQAALAAGIPYGEGLLWEVVETGQPVFVENYSAHPKAVKAFKHPAIGQLGIFPIPSVDGTIIGVLTLESRSVQKLQEAPQQDMLLAACRTLGAAIERVQAQDRLHRINQDLERASRLKSEFLASMSHELRTPLNSILGFSELMLRRQGQWGDREVSHLNAIRQSGHHLLQLINDILDLSKVEAGKVELDLQPISVQDLCRQCLKMVQPRADRKRLVLCFEVDYRIDQVLLDERRTRQMIINLLSNAVKFTPEKGQVKLGLRLAYGNQLLAEQRPDQSPVNSSTPYLCIEVIDTGIGVASDKLHLLFRPFQQIDSSLTRQHEGTGLGLALTKRLAELHGGTVSYESAEGAGSTFRIWLPINEWRETFEGPTAALHEGFTPTIPSFGESVATAAPNQVRILVVEDQPYNQALISEILESEGYQVELISDGDTMQSTIESEFVQPSTLPHLILMDIQLPGVDGLALMRQLKANPLWQRIPVVAVTAMAMAGDRDLCMSAGADGYLSKPLDLKAVSTEVNRLLKMAYP